MTNTIKNIKILVVEDEPLLRMDLVDNLQDAGFEVLEASNSVEAIEILSEHGEVRLMMTDVDMPGGMDGVKLAAYVRDRWPPLKIIVVSGHRRVSMDDIPAESRFFSKPYDPRRLIKSIHEMLTPA